MFVAATVATSLAFVLFAAPTTHAADVMWNGDSIIYDGNQYQKATDATADDGMGLPVGSHVYRYITPRDASLGANAPPQKAYVIYFAPGKDPTKEKNAQFAIYDFTPPATFTNKTGQKSVSVAEKQEEDKGSSCKIDGIGWLVCSISEFLATSVDWLYTHVLSQFLAVRPVQSNTDNQLYKAWAVMRNIANVAFVGAFLVIIYSQVTSIGLSNYGIKKLLPRLIIAAVLVNVSYWICAIAIDLSNIAGYALNDLLKGITEGIRNSGTQTDLISFESVTGAVLSGGTLATAGTLSIIANGGIAGSIAMLLPALVIVLIAAMVAVIIMAARQALIVILVIVAPLAFVAYLLPNTEKFFEKWKGLMTTMLMLFPVFSVIFGGSQLAGTAIVQNADSIVMLILGMTVQVAPLVILPFLIKFSGSLLGRIAGMTNDRTKGLLDETRNYAKSIADDKRAATLARPAKRRNLITRAVQAKENGRRDRESRQKNNEMLADARYERREKTARLHDAAARAEMLKNMATHDSEAHVERTKMTDPTMRRLNQQSQAAATRAEMLKNTASTDAENYAANLKRTDAAMQELDLQARAGKLTLDTTNTKVETTWEQFKAGDTTGIVHPEGLSASGLAAFTRSRQNFADATQATSQEAMLTTMRQDMAKRKQSANLSDTMLKDRTTMIEGQTILDYAGGIMGSTGANSAFSKAITLEREEFGKNVENVKQLFKHFDVSSSDKQKIALGGNVRVEKNGRSFLMEGKTDEHVFEAALSDQLKTGSYAEQKELILESGAEYDSAGKVIPGTEGKTYKAAGSISRDIQPNGIHQRAAFFGSKIIDDIGQGKVKGEPGLHRAIVFHVEGGKLKEDTLSGMDAGALKDLFEVVADRSKATPYVSDSAAYDKSARELRKSIEHILDTDILLRNTTKKARDEMQDFLSKTSHW